MTEISKLVENLVFGRVEGGAQHGLPSFFVTFTGNRGDRNDVAGLLYLLQHEEGSSFKTVYFDGNFTEENDEDIQVLIASLKNYGWWILASTRPGTYRPWFTTPVRVGGALLTGIDWLSIRLSNEDPWTPFWVNEIVLDYFPEESDPLLPDDPNNLIRYYISGDEDAVLEFMKKSDKKWRWL